MYDADLPPDGVLAVLGVVDEIVVVLVAGRDIALVVMCKQDIVALVGDLAELELLIELDGVEIVLLAEVVDRLVLGSFALGKLSDDFTCVKSGNFAHGLPFF